LFYTTFIGCGPASDLNEIPQYQVLANAAEARRRIEELCVELGYAEVLWADTMVVPPAHRNDVAGLPFTPGPSVTRAGKPAGR
jgi:hypothetical protein